eukprot:UN21261
MSGHTIMLGKPSRTVGIFPYAFKTKFIFNYLYR